AVTPYRTASLPVEIYFFTRYNLSAGQATAVVTAGGAISVLFYIIALPPALFFTAWKIKVGIGVKSLFALAGIAAIAFFVFLIYSMREPEKFASIMEKVTPPPLRKKRWFQLAVKGVANWAGDFSSGLQAIVHYKATVIASTFILTAVFMGLGVLVAPLILWGLGYPEHFLKALLAQLAVSCLQPFMVVPGESGLAEVTFAGIFSIFIEKNLVGVVTLAWRFFTFYFTVGVMGIIFIFSLRDIHQGGEKLNPEALFEDSPVDS
ncbi:MAG: flippase-like domain-containing protein, partial [Actinomycetota bacterium]|nr:flippase-like domain-containing protein [Actinomycetota bacterium]